MNKRKRNPTRKQQKKDEYIKQCMTDYKKETITKVHYVKKWALSTITDDLWFYTHSDKSKNCAT